MSGFVGYLVRVYLMFERDAFNEVKCGLLPPSVSPADVHFRKRVRSLDKWLKKHKPYISYLSIEYQLIINKSFILNL
jgi:hypothetical protein